MFCDNVADVVCMLNSARTKAVMESLNPGLHFLIDDVERIALFQVENAQEIFGVVEHSFAEHESQREPSIEFRQPGPSSWGLHTRWAQAAVDRAEGEPLPPYEPAFEYVHLRSTYILLPSVLRSGASTQMVRGRSMRRHRLALSAGILFASSESNDSLDHPALQAARGRVPARSFEPR